MVTHVQSLPMTRFLDPKESDASEIDIEHDVSVDNEQDSESAHDQESDHIEFDSDTNSDDDDSNVETKDTHVDITDSDHNSSIDCDNESRVRHANLAGNRRRVSAAHRKSRISGRLSNPDKDNKFTSEETLESGIHSSLQTERRSTGFLSPNFLLTSFILVISVAFLMNAYSNRRDQAANVKSRDFKINFEKIDEINRKYPKLLTPKSIRIIKARLSVMRDEISILLLVGRAKDNRCNIDPTFCVGQTIANSTEYQFNYLDASDDRLDSGRIGEELAASFDNHLGRAVMIDRLEELPGNEVMNLFQFIDKDDKSKRRGMLLFVIYTGLDIEKPVQKLKESELVEKILVNRWSPFIPKDSLTSVISRISGSVVKLF